MGEWRFLSPLFLLGALSVAVPLVLHLFRRRNDPVVPFSALRFLQAAPIEQAIKDSVDGNYSSEPFVGTLENEGVGLAPYHDLDSEIPQELKDRIEELKQQIIAGEIQVG